MCIFNIRFIYSIHIIQVFSFVCVLTWSLLAIKKSLGHAQIGLLYGFNSKFPTSIPIPFICSFPPPPGVTGPQKLAIIGALRCGGDPAKISESNLSK